MLTQTKPNQAKLAEHRREHRPFTSMKCRRGGEAGRERGRVHGEWEGREGDGGKGGRGRCGQSGGPAPETKPGRGRAEGVLKAACAVPWTALAGVGARAGCSGPQPPP